MTSKECPDHPKLMIDSLRELRARNEFCDATIIAGDEKIKVHRVVLASASRYFKEVFRNDGIEATTGILVFPDTPAETMKQCVEFIYSGKAEFSSENVKQFLKLSEKLGLAKLSALYLEFLSENVNLGNSSEVISVTRTYGRGKLFEPIRRFLMENFKIFVESDVFLSLDKDCFEYLFMLVENSRKDLEEAKVDMIKKWVKHDLEKRQENLHRLFLRIDMSFLSKEYIKKSMITETFISSSADCLRLISESLLDDKRAQKRKISALQSSECLDVNAKKGRVDSHTKSFTQVLSCNTESKLIYKGDLTTNTWSRVTTFPSAFDAIYLDIAEYGGSIYVSNGKQINCFNGTSWRELWNGGRQHPAQYNRCVAGDGYVCMVTKTLIVTYQLSSSKTSFVANSHGDFFCVAYCLESVYIMGGKETEKRVSVAGITGKWLQRISPMNFGRVHGVGMVYQDDVYVLGGVPKNVEFYNTNTRQWIVVRNLEIKCSNCKAIVGDKLYLFGGKLQDNVETIELARLHVSDEEKQPTRRNVQFDVICGISP